MKKQLDEFYLNIALEIARAEREAADIPLPVPAARSKSCLLPTRAEAVGLGAELTSEERSHMDGCGPCSRLVEMFVPPSRHLLDALKRHAGGLPERLLGEWVETAQANAAQFVRWLKGEEPDLAFFDVAPGRGRTGPFV